MYTKASVFITITSCFLLSFISANAQIKNYPKNYFRNPLDIPIMLAGNFGECRSGHFHSGIDIKTQGKENLIVRAAAEGYVSRIKTEKGGFGHAIYITHPNGFVTLYAHLNNFAPEIQQYLRTEQYKNEKWNLDISLTKEQFPVKKGQQIAFSGNTGASSAPHLHFEIRDAKTEHPLNPQLFGFEIIDNLSPTIRELVIYNGNVYDRSLVSYDLIKKDGIYIPAKSSLKSYSISGDTIEVPEGQIGFGVNADDYMNGSTNTITFQRAELYVNELKESEVFLDDIGYDVSRYIHAYTDYYAHEAFGKWIQCLFRIPGNKIPGLFAYTNKLNGKILSDSVKKITITLTDNNDNKSTVSLYIKPKQIPTPLILNQDCQQFYWSKSNTYLDPDLTFTLEEGLLYDDICFRKSTVLAPDMLSNKFVLHTPNIPIHKYFDLKLKARTSIAEALSSKVVMYYSDGKSNDAKAAESIGNNWYKSATRKFGTYWLSIDTTGPEITSTYKNNCNLSTHKSLNINAKDAITSIAKYKGTIDGKWVCFEQRGNKFFYEFDKYCGTGKHELVFWAADENGNESKYTLTFIR